MAKVTRGIRNNNPGNIDFNPRNDWDGQIGIEKGVPKPRFAEFVDPESGIRALAKLVLNYRGKDGEPGVAGKGIDTVQEIINRWAPSVENNTSAYVNAVARAVGVRPYQAIDVKNSTTLTALVRAIISHENAGFEYPSAILAEGIRRALA